VLEEFWEAETNGKKKRPKRKGRLEDKIIRATHALGKQPENPERSRKIKELNEELQKLIEEFN